MLTASVPRESYVALPALAGFDTVPRRARAYLHANCAFCHQANAGGAAGASTMDLRFAVPLPGTGTCGTRLVPGNPGASSLVTTMRATDATRMPPLASALPHEAAITVVDEWIRTVPPGCP